VFDRTYAWRVWRSLDAAAMHAAGQTLVGTHDFASFQSAGSERQSTVRTIYELTVRRGDAELLAVSTGGKGSPPGGAGEGPLIAIEIEGNGFLYNMVRAIAGTLVEVGRRKRRSDWVGDVLAAGDRSQAGPTAPAHGLFLLRVDAEEPA
jgi:tRNA pseudouridine38-40 synthase